MSLISLLISQSLSLIIIPIYIYCFVLFLSPGLLGVFFLKRRFSFNPVWTLPLTIIASCLLGYLAFWIYLWSDNIGRYFSVIILASSVLTSITLAFKKDQQFKKFISQQELWQPILIMFGVGLFYLSVLYIVELTPTTIFTQEATQIPMLRFRNMPPDNIIPLLFADKLFHSQFPSPIIPGLDWLSSDRPPLQTGLNLIQRPVMFVPTLSYQILSTILQCSWVAAIYSLGRTVRLSQRQIITVLAFAIFSGFFLLNSVFVWPKLLAGSLATFSLGFLLESTLANKAASLPRILAATTAGSLALLSHGGVIFCYPALALIPFLSKRFPKPHILLAGIIAFSLLIAPWSAYQKFYDPPGNRLVKMHLAGVEKIDSRSSFQAISDAYQNLTFPEWQQKKWGSISSISGNFSFYKIENWLPFQGDFFTRLENEFYYLFLSFGVLNFGWIMLIFSCFYRNKKIIHYTKQLFIIFVFTIVALGAWILIMFDPVIIHTGSYGINIVMFSLLGMSISFLPKLLVYFLFGLHFLNFATIWLLALPHPPNVFYLNFIMLATEFLCLIGIFCIFYVLSNSKTKVNF